MTDQMGRVVRTGKRPSVSVGKTTFHLAWKLPAEIKLPYWSLNIDKNIKSSILGLTSLEKRTTFYR